MDAVTSATIGCRWLIRGLGYCEVESGLTTGYASCLFQQLDELWITFPFMAAVAFGKKSLSRRIQVSATPF